MRVGDQGAAPLPGSDPSVVPGRGGTLPLSVWLAGTAGAERAELCGHQVGPEEFQLLLLQEALNVAPWKGTKNREIFLRNIIYTTIPWTSALVY